MTQGQEIVKFRFYDTGNSIQEGEVVYYIVERDKDKNGNKHEVIKNIIFGTSNTRCSQGIYRHGFIRSDQKLFAILKNAEHELSVNKLWHSIWECMQYKRKRPEWMSEGKTIALAKLLNLI